MSTSTEPTVPEDDVLKHFMANESSLAENKVDAAVVSLNIAVEEAYARQLEENNKLANKKKEENLEFNNALDIACVIVEAKLILHLSRLHEEMVKTFHQEANKANLEGRLQKYFERLNHPISPVPLILPHAKETKEAYTEKVLAETQKMIAAIEVKEAEVKKELVADWGADNWDEGLKKQTETIHEQMAKDIDNLTFLKAVEKSDGSTLDPSEIAHELVEKLSEGLRKINDNFRDFTSNYPFNSPHIVDDPNQSNVINPDAPAAPEIDLTVTKTHITSKNDYSQFSIDANFKFMHDLRNLLTNKGKPAIEDAMVTTKDGTEVNRNSALRFALRHAKNAVEEPVKKLADKVTNYNKNQNTLKNLGSVKSDLQQKSSQLSNDLQQHHDHTRPQRRM